ncbi:MAG: TetR/AcrR family transcriptional regulator [Deltaproteobacteria bacterium]|nr:TetR/AcrR family transcriptional regulator [Deltaproteobacteria bacterium]
MTSRRPAAVRRREIADAAIKLIGERGLREFTAARLASEVGITDGTIFGHFKDMSEVAVAAFERIQERLIDSMNLAVENPVERLREFVLGRIRLALAEPETLTLLFSDHLALAMGVEGPSRISALRNRGRAYIASCIREAARQDLIRADVDVEAAVLVITGVAIGFLFAGKDGALSPDSHDIEERAWRSVLRSLGGKEDFS